MDKYLKRATLRRKNGQKIVDLWKDYKEDMGLGAMGLSLSSLIFCFLF